MTFLKAILCPRCKLCMKRNKYHEGRWRCILCHADFHDYGKPEAEDYVKLRAGEHDE